MEFAGLILLIPLLQFVVAGLFGKEMRPSLVGAVCTAGMAIAALISWVTALSYFGNGSDPLSGYAPVTALRIPWLNLTETLHIELGILLDPISVMMLVVVTTVSLMVHLYSLGYMKGEKGFQRYYALLSLFSFSMLGLVVATNLFQMYIFWELVGVSSFSLIGFYYTKPSAVAASKKAFIVTRFADLGFLAGILIISYYSGSFQFSALTAPSAEWTAEGSRALFLGGSALSWALGLIFIGGAGKSAMMPLHIWLPDAMEGPTPVSALIHAATMVVAGVFLVARLFPLYSFAAPELLGGIAWVGGITALGAALIACTQTDIKRVLAFSTISQIAFMMAGLGVSGYGGHEGLGYMASMFHLFTHAFFKALLFLGAGAVIHAVHSNEMDRMGNLRKFMPITHITFLIACLSIAGIPPFSGFFSKDEIMAAVLVQNPALFSVLLLTAGLTAFYMFRLYFRIFHGPVVHYAHTPHEAPAVMTIPLLFLAFMTVVSGFIPFSQYISSNAIPFETHLHMGAALPSLGVGLIGILIATRLYAKESTLPQRAAQAMHRFYTLLQHKFYFDEVWLFVVRRFIVGGIALPIAWFDRHIVDGFMNLQATVSNQLSEAIKNLQSGYVQTYAWIFMSAALLMAFLMFCM